MQAIPFQDSNEIESVRATEFYRAVVEQTTDGIALIEPESLRVVECNEAFSRLIGCESVEEAKTLTGFDFSTASREELLQLTTMVMEQKTVMKGERVYRRRDGSLVEVEITANFVGFNDSHAFCLNIKDITDRKKTEVEIHRLALVAQKTQNSVIVSSPEGDIQWVNEGFTRLTGYALSEALGKSSLILCGEGTSIETLSEMNAAVSLQNPFEGELLHYKKNGEGYWVSVSLMPIKNEKDELQGYISIEMDITERKQMEERLRTAHSEMEHRVTLRTAELNEAREFLHSVIDKVPYPIFVKDIEGKYVLGNQAFADARGTTVQNLIGKTRADFGADPDEVKVFTDEDVKLLQNLEDKFVSEEMLTAADGKPGWYQTSKRSVALGEGGVRFLIGVSTDITERKHAEVELSGAQQFLRNVIDNIPNLIFVKDPEGRFTLANRALAKVYGTSVKDLLGKTVADFNRPADEVEKILRDEKKVVEDWDEILNPEEKLTDCNGNVHWMQTAMRPMFGDAGVEYILGIGTDLTERKILEGQLHNAQKLESIGQLAAGIAHEINTPTQWVSDNTRFIQDSFTDFDSILAKYGELFDAAQSGEIKPELISGVKKVIDDADLEYLLEEVPKAIGQSMDGVSRIAKIVQSMKDFAHPGASAKQSADLNRAIESTITVASNEWKYVADMETSFDESLPTVPCYLGEFNQVILNMVVNAAQAITDVVGDASQGKGKITITTTKVNDDWVEVRIGDTGNGIPLEAQPRVFDPFFTTKEVGKGTGQRLAISHSVVVEKHGGELRFETEPGQGTTFIIRLPLEDPKDLVQDGNLNHD